MLPLSLPPAYTLAIVARDRDPVRHARATVARGVEDGLLILADRADRLELAILTEPAADPGSTVRGYLAFAVAVADMLAASLPPMLAVALRWPALILVDGSPVGRLRLCLPEPTGTEPFAWAILGLELGLRSSMSELGRGSAELGLDDCGATGLEAFDLAESLARHFLYWLDRLDRDGLDPVRQSWNARCHGRSEEAVLTLQGRSWQGRLDGLDGEGRLVVGGAKLALLDHLAELG